MLRACRQQMACCAQVRMRFDVEQGEYVRLAKADAAFPLRHFSMLADTTRNEVRWAVLSWPSMLSRCWLHDRLCLFGCRPVRVLQADSCSVYAASTAGHCMSMLYSQ